MPENEYGKTLSPLMRRINIASEAVIGDSQLNELHKIFKAPACSHFDQYIYQLQCRTLQALSSSYYGGVDHVMIDP